MQTCKKCGKEFIPQKGLKQYCSMACKQSRTFTEETKNKISKSVIKYAEQNSNVIIEKKISLEKTYLENPNLCKNCNTALPFESKLNQFCSKSCSATFNNKLRPPMSLEQREKISKTTKEINTIKCSCLTCKQEFTANNIKTHLRTHLKTCKLNYCIVCNKPTQNNRKTCSEKCLNTLFSENAKTSIHLNGNHNRHSGWVTLKNGNKFYAESKWEEKLVLLLEDNNITFIRPKPLKYTIKDVTKNYFPDVYLPDYDIFLEPKNPYLLSLQIEKLESVQKTHNISLLVIDNKDKINNDLISYIITTKHQKSLIYI